MADEFGDDLETLQKDMSNLIVTGIIDAKIDEENQVFFFNIQCLYLRKGVNNHQIILNSYNAVNFALSDQQANVLLIYIIVYKN